MTEDPTAELSEFLWVKPDQLMIVTTVRVVEEAKALRSEHGENPEYDRALVELTMRLLDLSEDDRSIAELLVLRT